MMNWDPTGCGANKGQLPKTTRSHRGGRLPRRSEKKVAFYLSILDRYINSRWIRRNWTDERFDGPGAGFPHESLSMRNYIHTRWGAWLEMELDEPDDGAKRKAWTKYRTAVSQAIHDYRMRAQ